MEVFVNGMLNTAVDTQTVPLTMSIVGLGPFIKALSSHSHCILAALLYHSAGVQSLLFRPSLMQKPTSSTENSK